MRQAEKVFWNNPEIGTYFETKPADPRIESYLRDHNELKDSRALDLGCGGGRHSHLLAELGLDVSSIDVNPGMLEITSRRLAENNLSSDIQYGSILSIPYPDESFDVIVTTGVLHQAQTTEEYIEAVNELARVTKDGGVVLLNIFTNAVWDVTYKPVKNDCYAVTTHEGLPMTLLPKNVFNEIMAATGFELFDEQGEDIKQENTGPRAVYRAFYQKVRA